MAMEIEETAVYGLPAQGDRMTLEDGLLREKYGPGNLEVDDFYNAPGNASPMGSPDEGPMLDEGAMRAEVSGMSDEEIMAGVNGIPSGTEEEGYAAGQAEGEMDEEDEEDMGADTLSSPTGPMAYAGDDSGVGTPTGQNAYIGESLERNEQPEVVARELLARRAAARMNLSQNFQKEAESLNAEDPFKQSMG